MSEREFTPEQICMLSHPAGCQCESPRVLRQRAEGRESSWWRERDMTDADRVLAERLDACSEDLDLAMVGRAVTAGGMFDRFLARERGRFEKIRKVRRANLLMLVVGVDWHSDMVRSYLECGHTKTFRGPDRWFGTVGRYVKCGTCAVKFCNR